MRPAVGHEDAEVLHRSLESAFHGSAIVLVQNERWEGHLFLVHRVLQPLVREFGAFLLASQVILPNGSIVPATRATLIPSPSGGYISAFPIL